MEIEAASLTATFAGSIIYGTASGSCRRKKFLSVLRGSISLMVCAILVIVDNVCDSWAEGFFDLMLKEKLKLPFSIYSGTWPKVTGV